MPKGTVKRFGSTRGFGFVAPDGGGLDGFVRVSAVPRAGLRSLTDKRKVAFVLQPGRALARGLLAPGGTRGDDALWQG
ncbi:MAG: cold-shock protein [Rhodobacter sp.]|nr:cold-shock protein [Rhodobacter sp.]MCA3513984.1 cold-shock protein [Rhodobacter sp.]MCA3521270.1 cold-shock protein [Rhodobacter sp.]MCA3523062.1 cold-shock protein [Rhodobacter sp.]MCA3525838.1 cold-shock protein [Rhodobacter sp.]